MRRPARSLPADRPAPRQPTPDDLLSDLTDFVRRKFYPANSVAFAKDRRRLLKWVILWPAGWLNTRGVTVTPVEYRRILEEILHVALGYGDLASVRYLPAYLAEVVQSHFRVHGDEIYERAKSVRALADQAILVLGHTRGAVAPDPVSQLAAAARLLTVKKSAHKAPLKTQLNLF